MEKGKPHLDSKMNLSLLANRLEINPNYVSQIINDQLQQNFYDFINQYRVEEFKNRLNAKTAARYTLLSHALASGFSSKSSFNEAFKRITGQTPSEFQKNLPSTN
jgi:AraC-like DNA-binding protein